MEKRKKRYRGIGPPPEWPTGGFPRERVSRSLLDQVEVEGVYWFKDEVHPFNGVVKFVCKGDPKYPGRFHFDGTLREGGAVHGTIWCD